MVVNEILEKVRSQIPGTDSLMPPPKDTKVTLLNFLVRAEPLDCPGHINQHQTLGMEGWLTRSDTATLFGYSWCKHISSTGRKWWRIHIPQDTVAAHVWYHNRNPLENMLG